MSTTKNQIREWFLRGKEDGATHMIIGCDTFDHSDFPVFVMPAEDVHEIEAKLRAHPMQTVLEVYHLGMDVDEQLAKGRVFNYEIPGQEKPKCPFDMTPLVNVGVLPDYGDEQENHICPLCKRVWLDVDKEDWHSRTAKVRIVGALKDVSKDGIKYTDIVKVVG